jgi:acetyltransferase-like isoleucine patch superfamily enzyme
MSRIRVSWYRETPSAAIANARGLFARPPRATTADMAEFAYLGKNVTIYPWAKILGPASICLGSNVIVDDFVFIGNHEELTVGNHVHIASHASITGGGKCYLADFCGISSGARILTGTDDFSGAALTGPTIPAEFRCVIRGSVTIGEHAVIGANCVVLPNVRVGNGAAVGAGSVVTRDLEPWTIFAGAPARPLKPRSKETILEAEKALFAKYGRPERLFRS